MPDIVAPMFFISFTTFSTLVLMNVVVAILAVAMTDSNEDVVLDAIANQVKALEELSPEELEVKLGLQPVEKFTGKSRRMNDDEKDAYDN